MIEAPKTNRVTVFFESNAKNIEQSCQKIQQSSQNNEYATLEFISSQDTNDEMSASFSVHTPDSSVKDTEVKRDILNSLPLKGVTSYKFEHYKM